MKKSILALALALCLLASGCAATPTNANPPESTPQSAPASAPQGEAEPPQTAADQTSLDGEYRAMWVSYLEWEQFDFSSEAAFAAGAEAMMQNSADLGLNVIIVQVRPFADALYLSGYFPWSHLCTGTQGQSPGFDPLRILVDSAHAHGLQIEAWINPYRIRQNQSRPGTLAENNLINTHPEWVKYLPGGETTDSQPAYLDPSSAEARTYIVAGVLEIVQSYDVDGIHFDDYFYPTTDPSFDAEEYAAQGGGLSLAEWRRANVNALVTQTYAAIKAYNPSLRFGISPQGNMDNNYNGQYSDVSLWMSTPGYLDYVLPQLYWGYGYTLQNGAQTYAYENIAAAWADLPRAPSVSLYFGLGAYRIGAGDGGQNANQQTQWETGENLAKMVQDSRTLGADGYVLYRYDNLFNNAEYPALAAAECAAIAAANAE